MRWATHINGTVIYGIGRAVRAVHAENTHTRSIVVKAQERYAASPYLTRHIPEAVFVPGMVSALLVRDTYPANPDPLTAFTLKALFAHGDAQRLAIAIYNATQTSGLAFDAAGMPRSDDAIATELQVLFKQHPLLRYPQDRAALGSLTVQQELPGGLVERLGLRRSTLPTFLREARQEAAYRSRGRR